MEKVNFFDALCHVFLSITTVGTPIEPQTFYGRALTMGLVFFGMEVVGGRQLANALMEVEKTEELETISKKKH